MQKNISYSLFLSYFLMFFKLEYEELDLRNLNLVLYYDDLSKHSKHAKYEWMVQFP